MRDTIVVSVVACTAGISVWYCYLWKCEIDLKRQQLKMQYLALFAKVAMKVLEPALCSKSRFAAQFGE